MHGTSGSGQHHVRLQDHPLQKHPLGTELEEDHAENLFRHLPAALQGVLAFHERFGFHDRNQTGLLAQRRVAGQGMRVGFHATWAGKAVCDGQHRAPLGETSPHPGVFGQAFAQSVQAFGDLLSRMAGHVLGPEIHLDPGNDSRIQQDLDEGNALRRALPDGLVVEDRASDALGEAGRGDDQLPVGSPRLHGLGNSQRREALVAGGVALVHGQEALVPGKERSRRPDELVGRLPRRSVGHHSALPFVRPRAGSGEPPGPREMSGAPRAVGRLRRWFDGIRQRILSSSGPPPRVPRSSSPRGRSVRAAGFRSRVPGEPPRSRVGKS